MKPFQRFRDVLARLRKTPLSEDAAATGLDVQRHWVLPETARQLEKPCLLLKRTGADRAAVWGGNGIAAPPPGPYRHWISVDSRFLANGRYGRQGVLSIYTNEEDCESGVTAFLQDAVLDDTGGAYLYAHPSVSLPPPDAGPDLDNEEYSRRWQQSCPVCNPEDVVAVLGGWHFPWPDGDWEALRERDLLVCTLENAEPWVEVWQWQQATTVMQRIT